MLHILTSVLTTCLLSRQWCRDLEWFMVFNTTHFGHNVHRYSIWDDVTEDPQWTRPNITLVGLMSQMTPNSDVQTMAVKVASQSLTQFGNQ